MRIPFRILYFLLFHQCYGQLFVGQTPSAAVALVKEKDVAGESIELRFDQTQPLFFSFVEEGNDWPRAFGIAWPIDHSLFHFFCLEAPAAPQPSEVRRHHGRRNA